MQGLWDTNDAPPLLPAEAMDYFRWDNRQFFPKHFEFDYPSEMVNVGDRRRRRVYTRSPQLLVASHNFARAENSKHCFMLQLHSLLAHAGHQVGYEWLSDEDKQAAAKQLPKVKAWQRAEELVAAEAIDWSTAQLYRQDIFCNQATEGQKWAGDRYFHCLAWGVDNMAAARHKEAFKAFLKDHGTDGEAYKLDLCAAIFKRPEHSTSALPAGQGGNDNVRAPDKLAVILRELLQACVISNPFDPEPVECQVTPAVQEQLRQCTAFQSTEQYLNVARLFGIKAGQGEQPPDFSDRGHATAQFINLFKKAGLQAETVRHGSRSHEKGKAPENSIPYLTFPVCDKNAKMAELVKVRVAEEPSLYNDEFATFMEQYELVHYQQLCGPVLARRARQRLAAAGVDDGEGEGASGRLAGGESGC